jgi:hypothetical protein
MQLPILSSSANVYTLKEFLFAGKLQFLGVVLVGMDVLRLNLLEL